MNKFLTGLKQLVSFLCGKRSHKVIAAVLSVVVVLSVCASLIMPAMSATTDEAEVLLGQSADVFSDFSEDKGMKLTDEMIDSTATVIEKSDDGNSVTVQFNMNYSCYDKTLITVSDSSPYLYYYIDPRIKENMTAEQLQGMTGRVGDGSGGEIGDYLIDFDNDRVIIRPDNPAQLQEGFSGNVHFNATVERKDNESGTTTEFVIGTQTVKVEGFTEKKLSIEKTGKLEADGRTITWEVTVDNPYVVVTDGDGNVTYEPNSLKDYTVTDTMFGGDTTVTSTPAGAGTYDSNTGTYTFGDVTDTKITLTYQTTLTEDQLVTPRNNNFDGYGEVTNGVSLNKGSDPVATGSATVPYELGYKIEKSGEVDYSKNPVEIIWTIKITNKYNLPVDDLKLYDSMFAEYINGDVTKIIVEPENVTASFAENDNSKIVLKSEDENNKYTGDITIKYTTQAKDGTTSYNNESQLEKNVPFVKTTASVSTIPFTFSKYGTNETSGDFNYWKISINNITLKGSELNGYYIEDNNFSDRVFVDWKGLDSNNFKIFSNLGQMSSDNYTIDENKLTFKGFNENDTLSWISIEYWTEPSNDLTGEDFTESFTDHNDAEIFNEGGKSFGTGSADVTWNPPEPTTEPTDPVETFGVNKKYTNSNLVADENGLIEIPWEIELWQQNGTFAGKTVTDTVSVPSEIADVDHYITDEQFSNIKVTANNSDLPAEYYDITSVSTDGKSVSFTITFADSEALADYSKIYVTYSTTAKVEGVEKGQTVNFNNSVDFSGTTSNPSYPYENVDTSVAPYTKYDASVDVSLQTPNGTTKKTQLETVTLDGIDYYKVDYIITVNDKNKFSSAFTLYDTFPEGFGFYDQSGIRWECSNGYVAEDIAHWTSGATYVRFATDNDGNNYLAITLDPSYNIYKSTLYYSLITPKDEFDKKLEAGGVEIVNRLRDEEGLYPEVTQTQKFEEAIITKKELAKGSAGFISYQVDVNPDGLALSRDGHLILTDIMKTADGDPSVIKAYLQSLEIYTKDSDGNYTVPLDSSQYNYVLDNNPEVETNEVTASASDYSYNGAGSVSVNNAIAGANTTISFKGNPNTKYATYIKDHSNTNLPLGNATDGYNGDNIIYSFTTDDDGYAEINFVLPNDLQSKFSLDLNTNWIGGGYTNPDADFSVESITYEKSGTIPYTAKMVLTVPDEMPLRIQYKYMGINPDGLQGENGTHSDESYSMTNTVNVQTSYISEDSKVDSDFIIDVQSGASLTPVKGLVTLQKVDVGDYSVKLDADFNIYKYDVSSQTWLPAVSVSEDTSSGKTTHSVEWGASADDSPEEISVTKEGYNIKLDEGFLYKLVEIRAPNGYVPVEVSNVVKYFSAGIYTGTVPDEAKNFTAVTASGELNIQNYKYISVGAKKVWADGSDTHSEVTVKLYQSSTIMTGGFPEDLKEVEGSEQTLNSSNNWSCKWENLPNGTSDGKPIYYYVKEEAYTEDGTQYTAFYVGNGLNSDGTVEITNTSGLAVKKIWHDYEGNECTPAAVNIKFKVYRSTTWSLDGSLPADAVEWTAGDGYTDGYYILNEANGWSMTFSKAEPFVEGDSSKPYYYYVVEDTSNLTDNKVSYIGNGSTSTGLIAIINKSTKIIAGEMPETGGPGTFAYTLTGGIIIICSAAAYVIRKRLLRE